MVLALLLVRLGLVWRRGVASVLLLVEILGLVPGAGALGRVVVVPEGKMAYLFGR